MFDLLTIDLPLVLMLIFFFVYRIVLDLKKAFKFLADRLTLSGSRFFRYLKDRGGGGWIPPPPILLKIGRWNTLYAHMLPLNFFDNIFSFEGARPEKGLKI